MLLTRPVNNDTLTVLICAITIVIYFIIMYFKKKIISKFSKIGPEIINIVLDIIILIGVLIFLMFISGYEFQFAYNSANVLAVINENMSRLIWSIFTIIVSLTFYNLVKLVMKRGYQKPGPYLKRRKTLGNVINSLTRYVLYAVNIAILLSIWGVDITPILAGLGIAGLVIGLGAQNLINDFISGVFIIFERHFDVSDIVEIGGFKGEVESIGLKTTRIKNWKNEVKVINNGSIGEVINFSLNNSLAVVEFSIAYKENIQEVVNLINTELPKKMINFSELLSAPVVVGTTNLGDSGITLRIIATTETEKHYGIEREIRRFVKEILDEHQIEIPFPQVVVHEE